HYSTKRDTLMKFFKILILTFIMTGVFTINAQEKITLRQAITTALHQNTSVIKSANNLETSNAAVKNAYGNFLPNLNFSSGWNWQRVSNGKGATVVNYFGEAQTLGPTETDSRSYSMSLGGNVTLFDGLANISSLNQKKNDLQSAKYDLDKLRQDVSLQTVNLFITITNNEKILKFQEEDLKYNKDMLNKVKEMFDLRMKANVDLYAQEFQTSNAQLSYLQAKSNYEKSKIALLNYLSKDILKDYTFAMDSSYLPDEVKNIDDINALYKTALINRSDYQSSKLKFENSEYQLTTARGGYFPSLSGNYGFSTSATQPKDLLSRKVYNFGLSLSLPIFSRWSTEYATQSAQVQIKNTNEDLNALERQIKSDLKNAVLDLQTATLQLEVTKAALKSALETWQIKRDSYTLGSATFIDQQQSYRDYVQATNNAIASESNYILKQFGLLSALGLLKTE
ncbi:MAG: TolC family protein, partial [Ignavibacteriaceae bacterium]|nr:TolC family protein [Ignavibacteriaceae bacterium]